MSTATDHNELEGDGLTNRARDEPHNEVRDPRRARSCAPDGRPQSVQGKGKAFAFESVTSLAADAEPRDQ